MLAGVGNSCGGIVAHLGVLAFWLGLQLAAHVEIYAEGPCRPEKKFVY